MHLPSTYLPVLDYLQRQIEGRLAADEATHMRYPTAISQMLGFRIVAVGEAMAVVEFDADAQRHGNQQGTVHGGTGRCCHRHGAFHFDGARPEFHQHRPEGGLPASGLALQAVRAGVGRAPWTHDQPLPL